MRIRPLLFALLAAVLALAGPASAAQFNSWVFYRGIAQGVQDYGRFDLAVLDGVNHPPLARTAPGKPLLLGYLSVGETDPGAPTWVLAQSQPFVLAKNEEWGTLVLDMRSLKWQGILLDIVIPKMLARGFDGIFLDTLDSPLGHESERDPAKAAELRTATLEFLRRLRQRFPDTHICMNRGYALLPEAALHINSLLIEDLSFEYDFASRQYRTVSPKVRQALVAAARKGLAANPALTVLSLDYAQPDQRDRIAEAIGYARSKGFVPYVGTQALDRVQFHTLGR